jgi:hypothetical protein
LQTIPAGVYFHVDSSHYKFEGGKKSHPTGKPVWVQCDGYRCLAVQDKHGDWWAFYNRAKINRVVKVLNYPTPH